MERGSFVSALSLSLRSVSKTFAEKVALDDVSIEVDPGSFVVLLGPSGSGKTTLLRCLAGIERPTSGEIVFDGRTVAGPHQFVPPEKRGLAMVFQDYALWPHLSVRRNVEFPMTSSHKVGRDERTRRVDDLLERVGISALADRYPSQLSGGEQQRVALARALAAHAGLILFDEPLSNLDADRRELLRVEIATLTREVGATAVYITHDQSEAFALADYVGVLHQGRLVQYDRPEAVYRRPADAFVARFTGVAGEVPVRIVTEHEGRYEVSLDTPSGGRLDAVALERVSIGDSATMFVRANGVTMDAPEATVSARVLDVAFTGRGYEHVVNLGDEITLSRIFSSRRFDRDSTVRLAFDAASCLIMHSSQEVAK